MMNDLEDLKLKRRKVTNETLASTRRMLGLVHESQDAGSKTLEMLHAQGDQLNNVDGGLDAIQTSLLRTEKHLTRMELVEKCFCCAFCQKRDTDTRKQKNQDDSPAQINTTDWKSGYDKHTNYPEFTLTLSKSKTSVHIENSDRDDTEGENNLAEIFAHIETLKGQALDLGQVVQSHNNQLDNMNIKAKNNEIKLKDVSGRTTNLLKSTSSTFPSGKCCRYFATLCNICKKT